MQHSAADTGCGDAGGSGPAADRGVDVLLDAPVDSVSCRLDDAENARNASDAVAPCTGLHRMCLSVMEMVISRYYHADDYRQAR